MSRTPLGSPVVPLVKMTKRSSPAVVAPQKCSGARGAAAARARAASTARTGRMAAANSAGVASSTSASVARVRRTLLAARWTSSLCQLIVTGTVPTSAAPSRKQMSSSRLSVK